MNVLSNILKILIVLLSLAVATVVILLGALVLFPSFSVFGIHYVNGDNKIVYSYYNVQAEDNIAKWNSVDTLSITTQSWDIYVYSINVTKDNHTPKGIDARLSRNYNGFANNSVGEATLSKYEFETKKDGNYLSLSTTEPSGWFSRFDCALYIYIDADTLKDKRLLIKSNTGKVVVGEAITNRSTTLNIQNVDIITDGGNTFINDVNVTNTLNIHKGAGNININPQLLCDVELAITSGLGNVYVNQIGSESVKKSLVIDELYNCGVTLKDIYGDLMVKAGTGIIKGTKVTGTLVFEGENCHLNLAEVGKNLFFNSTDGSLNVTDAGVVVADVKGSGNIYVKNLKEKSVLESVNGSIKVDNVYADLTSATVNGNITLNNEENSTVNFVVESTNGVVKITKVNGSVHFNTNNNGRATFTGSFNKLIGENIINTVSGEINIDMLDAGYGFMLKDWSTKSTVYFKLSRFEEFSVKNSADDDAYKNGVAIGGYSGSTDTLSISSNVGKLRVVHPDLV